MPKTVDLDDESPQADDTPLDIDDDGKVPCPECQDRFKPAGLKRHLTVTHGYEPSSNNSGRDSGGNKRRGFSIAESGAQLQRGASLLVAMACKDCAIVLYQDASKDWRAIDEFCEHRPKIKKSVIAALQGADILILLTVFVGTAQAMASHHSIGKHFAGLGVISADPPANGHSKHDPMQNMAQFLEAMDPDERNQILDQAIKAAAGRGNG